MVNQYNICFLPGVGFLRGPDPRPLKEGEYIAFIGPAHTFGRHADDCFANIVADMAKVNVFNLSTSAVGPRYYLDRPHIIEYLNKSSAVVIHTFTARSCGNSMYHNRMFGNNVFQLVGAPEDSPTIHENDIFPSMFQHGDRDLAIKLCSEMQRTWVSEMKDLLSKISAKKILLWFASREPKYIQDSSSYDGFCGGFPQLVNDNMINNIMGFVDRYVEVISKSGLPLLHVNRFTGEPGQARYGTTFRRRMDYYGSPEMHQEAAAAVSEALKTLVPEHVFGKRMASAHCLACQKVKYPPSAPDRLSEADAKLTGAISGILLTRKQSHIAGCLGNLTPRDQSILSCLAEGAVADIVMIGGSGHDRESKSLLFVGDTNRPPIDSHNHLRSLRNDGVAIFTEWFRPNFSKRRQEWSEILHDLGLKPLLAIDAWLVVGHASAAPIINELKKWLDPSVDPVFVPLTISTLGKSIEGYRTRNLLEYETEFLSLSASATVKGGSTRNSTP
ncbi:DUF6473 family protein [Azospirillum sp. ST 5-10]|uniref:DUF6473 family protein n=1 Tax=unclassified Azospirillum TaxID=2630922 RepID=UPI003F4A04AC